MPKFKLLASTLALVLIGCASTTDLDSNAVVSPDGEEAVEETGEFPPEVTTAEQAFSYDMCLDHDGEPYIAFSELYGEEQTFCSFGEEGECTQNELIENECFKQKSTITPEHARPDESLR